MHSRIQEMLRLARQHYEEVGFRQARIDILWFQETLRLWSAINCDWRKDYAKGDQETPDEDQETPDGD